MPVAYEYDSNRNIIHARPFGDLSINDIVRYFMEVAEDNSVRPGIIEVVHLRDVENFLFTSKNALDIPRRHDEFMVRKNITCTIFVGRDDIHYGVARMFQNLFSLDDRYYTVFVVRTEEDANRLIKEIGG